MTPLSSKISQVLQKRLEIAQKQLNERVQSAFANNVPSAATPWDLWSAGARYGSGRINLIRLCGFDRDDVELCDMTTVHDDVDQSIGRGVLLVACVRASRQK